MRFSAGQAVRRSIVADLNFPFKHVLPKGTLLPCYHTLNILVWNIYKQQRINWQSVFKCFGQDCDLVLLQEAHTTPEFINYVTAAYAVADQAPALTFNQHTSGVMTMATVPATYCHPLYVKEPLIRLDKSALINVYPMPDGQLLMSVNVHAVNFSFGIDIYRKQLDAIFAYIQVHAGPVIVAGDFNAWSRARMHQLQIFQRRLKLQEVTFDPDHRSTVFGRHLDFIFYRGLELKKAQVIETEASDHNPLKAEFSFR